MAYLPEKIENQFADQVISVNLI